jgi:hypothetical protein
MAAEFDIPQKTFDFKKDLSYGESGEELVKSFFATLSDGAFEVKSDRYRNGRMVIETEQNPRGTQDSNGDKIWVKSGINITTAKWWVYIYAMDGSFVIISVARLKRFLRKHPDKFNQGTKRDFGGQDNPAKGFLIYPEDVIKMMYDKEYDETE